MEPLNLLVVSVTAYLRSLRASSVGKKEHTRNVKGLTETESNIRLLHFIHIFMLQSYINFFHATDTY